MRLRLSDVTGVCRGSGGGFSGVGRGSIGVEEAADGCEFVDGVVFVWGGGDGVLYVWEEGGEVCADGGGGGVDGGALFRHERGGDGGGVWGVDGGAVGGERGVKRK